MPSDDSSDAKLLIDRVSSGDESAAEQLFPLVYSELRSLAEHYFRSQNPSHTLQPTAVVHEAYLKLIRGKQRWESRAHFCAVAAKAMRQILINHARDKRALKRSGNRVDLSIADMPFSDGPEFDVVVFDEVLSKLQELDAEYYEIVELRFFGGLSVEETAHVTNSSARTVKRKWRQVRAWLSSELSEVDL